jgi:nucleotide-binding universal stress UspA family protein
VFVFVVAGSAMAGLVPSAGPVINEAEHQIADELRAQIEEAARRIGLLARFIETSGDPTTSIKRICEKVLADAVVVGASTSAGHRIVGSVGVRLVRAGKWPVIVVP